MSDADEHRAPGRSCPLHYRYAPGALRHAPEPGFDDLEVLYVVGGLYGNELALQRVMELFDAEHGRKRLVFNGDFHWFDVDPESFARLQRQVCAFDALRGNVETELASDDATGDAGCGCAYPDWVGDKVVERSNRILQRLRTTAIALPALRRQLEALPMYRRACVGELQVGVVHGDAESLSGWGFAQEALRLPQHQARLRAWFEAAGVDVFASSHTCLPMFHTLDHPERKRPLAVLNNGAAGMPNFKGDLAGLLTRISVEPFNRPDKRHGIEHDGVFMDAVAIEHDARQWQAQFLRQWPVQSDAHASYWDRITQGPDYGPEQALNRTE